MKFEVGDKVICLDNTIPTGSIYPIPTSLCIGKEYVVGKVNEYEIFIADEKNKWSYDLSQFMLASVVRNFKSDDIRTAIDILDV